MAKKTAPNVTMRIKIADNELEVTGPRGFVEKKIAEFVDLQKKQASTAPVARGPARSLPEQPQPHKKLSAAQFFKKVNPRTDTDRTLAAGYYLESYTGMDSFCAVDVRDIIQKQAKPPPPKNVHDAINKNIRKGLMMSAGDKDGRMAFVLTSDGEEEIKSLLGE